MSNYQAGHHAEKRAASYLISQGFRILNTNWKTRYCEIDIVAQKADTIYFVEVKYRRSASQGHGTDYITPRKLKQMQFAAEMWLQDFAWDGPCCLSAVSIDGAQIELIEAIVT